MILNQTTKRYVTDTLKKSYTYIKMWHYWTEFRSISYSFLGHNQVLTTHNWTELSYRCQLWIFYIFFSSNTFFGGQVFSDRKWKTRLSSFGIYIDYSLCFICLWQHYYSKVRFYIVHVLFDITIVQSCVIWR